MKKTLTAILVCGAITATAAPRLQSITPMPTEEKVYLSDGKGGWVDAYEINRDEAPDLFHESRAGATVKPQIIVRGPEDESLEWYLYRMVIKNDQYERVAYINGKEFDVVLEAFNKIPEGKYNVTCLGSFKSNDNNKNTYTALYYDDVEFSEESEPFEIKFSDLKNNITSLSLEADGLPFEGVVPTSTLGGQGSAIFYLGSGELLEVIMLGSADTPFMCNDITIPSSCTWMRITFDNPLHFTQNYNRLDGPFTEDRHVETDISQYVDIVSPKFALTDRDFENPIGGIGGLPMIERDYGCVTAANSRAWEGFKPDEVHGSVIFPESRLFDPHVGFGDAVGTGTGVVVDMDEYGMFVVKYFGQLINVGGNYKYFPQMVNFWEGEFDGDFPSYLWSQPTRTYFPPVMIVDEPDVCFTKAMISSGWIEFVPDFDSGEGISEIQGALHATGPYNEDVWGISPLAIVNYLTSVRLNGVDVPLEDMYEMTIEGGDAIEATLKYDDYCINGEIPTSNEITMGWKHWGMLTNDMLNLNCCKVLDAEGTITNRIKKGDQAKLYIVATENEGLTPVTVYLQPQDESAEPVMLIPEGEGEYWGSIGSLFTFDLSGLDLTEDSWYRVIVKIDDGDGTYMHQNVNHCFECVAASSIEAPTTDSTDEMATEWYDLQGRRVDNPANGIFVKSVRMADGTRLYSKKVIK